MKRKIIEIDEALCNGCGQCVVGCHEGALQIIDGKARLVKEAFCDGLGDCIGECPTGALTITERDAEVFDEEQVKQHLEEQAQGSQPSPAPSGGCPGSRIRNVAAPQAPAAPTTQHAMPQVMRPELEQWPVMLHLLSPNAPYFQNKEFVLLSTCSSVACPDVQWRYIRGRAVAIACPKLDKTEGYVEKLTAIITANPINRIFVIRMEVPCCSGLSVMLKQAVAGVDRSVEIREVIVGIDGAIKSDTAL